MKTNEIVILSLKLLGIYIFVQGLGSLGSSIGINGINGFGNWSMYLGSFIFLISGLILIFRAENISRLLFTFTDEPIRIFDVSENFQRGALRVIGIYVAIIALPAFVHLIGQMIQYRFASSTVPDYLKEQPNFLIPFISQAILFLLGLFLALWPTEIIKALHRFDKTTEKMNT
jgi:hypothetical protein